MPGIATKLSRLQLRGFFFDSILNAECISRISLTFQKHAVVERHQLCRRTTVEHLELPAFETFATTRYACFVNCRRVGTEGDSVYSTPIVSGLDAEESNKSDENTSQSNKDWKLRGLQWRVDLGVLPRKPAPVDELRRAAADGRRRYAELRRQLLVDPHLMEDCQTQAQLNQDNPLSLDPESVWGQYFRNAELERTIDKDLMRLYPENGIFFQSSGCQAILRRILLVWSLIHPESSYRQGMHELLAPLAYVLHVDINHLQHIKYQCEDRFDDPFDRFSAPWTTRMERSANVSIPGAAGGKETLSSHSDTEGTARLASTEICCEPSEDDEDLQAIILGSDNYGTEGELGALLSTRFLEHDAYCMFNALLSGQKGAVVMADYFLTCSGPSSFGGNPPVLETSKAIYRALAAVDKPLYTHLVELGIEPQYFTLRWLRLLFGREFTLENLLLLWDAIFSASNTPISSGVEQENFSSNIQYSAQSAFISSLAVSMLLYVRPVLLASPDAAGCLKRLLNYPQISDIKNLIETAKFLQPLVQVAARTPAPPVPRMVRTPEKKHTLKHSISRSISPPSGQSILLAFQERSIPCSPDFLRMSLPDGYWEEKWTHSILQKFISGEVMDAQGIDSAGKGLPTEAALNRCDGSERQQERGSAFENDFPKDGASEAGELLNQKTQIGNDIEVGAGASTHALVCDESEKLIYHQVPPVIMATCNSNLLPTEIQPVDEPKGGALLPLSIVGVHMLSTAQSPITVKYSTGNEEAGNATESTLHVTDQHVNVADEATKGSEVCNCMEPASNDEDQLLLQDCLVSKQDFSLQRQDSDLQPEYSYPQSSAESGKIAAELEVMRSVHVHGSYVEPSIMQAERGPLSDSKSAHHFMARSPSSITSVEKVEAISQTTKDLSLSDKPKPSPPTSKLNWVWNFRKNIAVEKTGNEGGRADTGSSQNVSESVVSSSRTEPGTLLQTPKQWWQLTTDVPSSTATIKESENTKDILENKAKQVSVPKSTELAVENFARLMPESVNDGSFKSIDLEEDSAAERMVVNPAKRTSRHNHTLQALGQSMLDHIQVVESSLSWAPDLEEEEQQSSQASLHGKGRMAVLVALAELRKISSALQHM